MTELIDVINQVLEKKRRFDCLRDTLRTCAQMWGNQLDAKSIWRNLSNLLEAKDPELVRHANRVNFYASLLAEHMDLSKPEREALEIGACLHDIGKVGLEERSSGKAVNRVDEPGAHVEIGGRMALSLGLPPEIGRIIRHHHEYYDGSGFPDRLRGEDIPCLARVVCIANEFDWIMTSHGDQGGRVHDDAREAIRSLAGTRFDPKLAKLFVQVVR